MSVPRRRKTPSPPASGEKVGVRSAGEAGVRRQKKNLQPANAPPHPNPLPHVRGGEGSALHGIGVDVLRIERMEQLLQRRGQRVLTRLLCAAERREVKQRTNTARALAMCWAAKEAFVKALGCGFSAGIAWSDVGVVREENGRPKLIFSRAMRARMKREGVGAAHISLSDDGGQVCAYVILERAARP